MSKTYECMILLDNREVRQGWEPLKQTVSGVFHKHGAELVSARRWDERRLAYPIKGQKRGTYLLVYYNAPGSANAGIRRDLELNEIVLRHMITTCEEVPADAYEPEAEFDLASIPQDDQPDRPKGTAAAADEAASGSDDDDAASSDVDDEVGSEEAESDEETKA